MEIKRDHWTTHMIFSNMGRFYQEADHEARDHKVGKHNEAVEATTVCERLE